MRDKISLKTKFNAVVLGILLVILSIVGVLGVTRTISDTGDSFDTFIRNSNGNYWACDESGLNSAIADIGDTGGTVWVGGDLTLTSEIRFNYSHLNLDFQGNSVTLDSDISFINVTDGVFNSAIRNMYINSHTGAVGSLIVLYIPIGASWGDNIYSTLFENIYINSVGGNTITQHNDTILHIKIDGATSIAQCTFRNFWAWYPGEFIKLECNDAVGWCNGNTFENMFGYGGFTTGIGFSVVSGSGNGFNGNLFQNVNLQSATYTIDGFKNISGVDNHFTDCMVWDWYVCNGNGGYQWSISNNADSTVIKTYELYSSGAVNDLGTLTTFNSDDFGHLYDRMPYDCIIFQDSSGRVYLQNADTGMIVYSNTSQYTYLVFGTAQLYYSSCFVKSGVYNITHYITRGSGTIQKMQFIGESKENTIFQCYVGASDMSIFSVNDYSDITFNNLCFEGNGASASGDRIAIHISGNNDATNITIKDCVFNNFSKNSYSGGVVSRPNNDVTSEYITITGCTFYHNYFGIRLKGYSTSTFVRYVDISHNTFIDDTYASIELNNTINSTISTNIIVNSGTYGIGLTSCYDCIISNNIIKAPTGIIEYDNSDYNIIIGNNCRSCATPIDINGANTINGTNLGTIS